MTSGSLSLMEISHNTSQRRKWKRKELNIKNILMSGGLSLIYTTSDSLYRRTKTMLSYKLVLNKFHYQVLVSLTEYYNLFSTR